MSFNATEIEQYYELYKLTAGGTDIAHYTTNDNPITYDGDVYTPAYIEKDQVTKDSSLQPSDLNLTFQITPEFEEYITVAPAEQSKVTIILYQPLSVYATIIFTGEIYDITITEKKTCSIKCREEVSLNTRIPQFVVQPGCNHQLFDSNCGLSEASYKVTVTVTGVTSTDRILNITDVSSYGATYFEGGKAKLGTDIRYITEASGTLLALQARFRSISVGDTIDLYPGCDKRPQTCGTKFSNFIHFLGSPYVPRKNPILENI